MSSQHIARDVPKANRIPHIHLRSLGFMENVQILPCRNLSSTANLDLRVPLCVL